MWFLKGTTFSNGRELYKATSLKICDINEVQKKKLAKGFNVLKSLH